MTFKHFIVAIDNSGAGRNAARLAASLASRVGAELTVLSVLPGEATNSGPGPDAMDGVETTLGKELFSAYPSLPIELAIARGVPQVEIPRFAERVKGDLIVLGRKPRSRNARLILGDTADAVVRRSRLPTLMVPAGLTTIDRMVVALDGTDRGLAVLRAAVALAHAAGLECYPVTVEPAWVGGMPMVSARSERLAFQVEEELRNGGRTHGKAVVTSVPLHIRRGDPVQETVAEANETGAEILVTGFHPGGPLLMVEEGSVSRKLLHAATCAVLTIPL